MTLSQLLKGCIPQGNFHIAYWGDEDDCSPVKEEWFEYQDGGGQMLSWAKENKLLSKKVAWIFATKNGYLTIELRDN